MPRAENDIEGAIRKAYITKATGAKVMTRLNTSHAVTRQDSDRLGEYYHNSPKHFRSFSAL